MRAGISAGRGPRVRFGKQGERVEVSGYLAVARRWWWTLLVATWVAAISGYVVASQIPPTYESRVQLLVGPYNTDSDTLRAAGQLVQTYAELVTTEPLLESAIAEVGADMDAGDLAAATRVTANDTTRFLSIRVEDTDPILASKLANALADEITLLASRGTSRPEGQLQIVDFAKVPSAPIAPQVSLIVGMAAIAALLGAMVLVMLVEYLSATVRTKEDLERLTELPFLGSLDTLRSPPSSPGGLVDRVPNSAAAAAYRLIAGKVAFRDGDKPTRSIVVVGTAPEGSNGQVAANLAAIVARGGRQVILVDADPGDALVTRIFGLAGRRGLTDVLGGPVSDVAQGVVGVSKTLRVMPRGGAGDADVIDVEAARRVLNDLERLADLVVVSTGPLHLSAGALVWARAGDATILVAVRDQSRRDDVTYAIEGVRLVGVKPSGTVLAERRRALGRGLPGPGRPEAEPPMASPIVGGVAAVSPGAAGTGTATAAVEPIQPDATVAPPEPTRRTTRSTRRRGSTGETGP